MPLGSPGEFSPQTTQISNSPPPTRIGFRFRFCVDAGMKRGEDSINWRERVLRPDRNTPAPSPGSLLVLPAGFSPDAGSARVKPRQAFRPTVFLTHPFWIANWGAT